jgi:hypothetical protein
MLLVAPTGLGKTNLALAIAFAISHGSNFLGWVGTGEPRRVLYIDGEMPMRLMRERLEDAIRRSGGRPAYFYILSREDFPDMLPLNTPAGQRFIDRMIEIAGGVDLVVFDNVQALLAGDMREELPWKQTLPWIRDLTRRKIGQIWVHHTGHDETHSYGTKTREWQLDLVALLEAIEPAEADIAFTLKLTKARERTPSTRRDFAPVAIRLIDDKWEFEPGEQHVRTKQTATSRALALLRDAIAREGALPPSSEHIPANTLCVTEGLWRRYCEKGFLSEGSPDAFRMAFKRATERLIGTKVGKWDLWVWLIP